MVSESPYIRWVKNKQPEPDPNYVHDLVVLRAMVRQEDRQGMRVRAVLGVRSGIKN